MPMRTKNDAIARLDKTITWLRGYSRGSSDDYTDSLARELERVRNWLQEKSAIEQSDGD